MVRIYFPPARGQKEPVPQRRKTIEPSASLRTKRNWGYQQRFGLFEISDVDMSRIARAMGASLV